MSGKKTKEFNDFICGKCSQRSYCKLISRTNQISRNHMKNCKRNNFKYWEYDSSSSELPISEYTIKKLKEYFYGK